MTKGSDPWILKAKQKEKTSVVTFFPSEPPSATKDTLVFHSKKKKKPTFICRLQCANVVLETRDVMIGGSAYASVPGTDKCFTARLVRTRREDADTVPGRGAAWEERSGGLGGEETSTEH